MRARPEAHRVAAALVIVAAMSAPPASAAGETRITVEVAPLVAAGEPSPGVVGRVVTAGIPFAPEDGLRDTASLRMHGTPAWQFRVLQRDPHTGHVTWVLATFVAGPGAATVVRTPDGAAPAAPGLGRDCGDSLVVETGAARFTIRKRGFNVFERVVRDGRMAVRPQRGGGIVVCTDGVRFESGLDLGSQAVIEEDGPARTTVRASGVLRDATGGASLAYTARLQFDRGRAACRMFVTLRNADRTPAQSRRFDAAWVEIPFVLEAPREVRIGFPGDGFAADIDRDGRAHSYQADNTWLRHARTGGLLPHLGAEQGLEVVIDGVVHNALGARGDVAAGWLRLDDGKDALLAGARDQAAWFPSGFDVDGDRLSVELFSRHNRKRGLVFAWGAHETREIVLEWAASGADPAVFRQQLQSPPAGRCEWTRYRDSGAFSGERRLVSVEESAAFFAALGHRWQPPRITAKDLEQIRRYNFGTTGGPNQFDQDECLLLEYARGGNTGAFLQARLGVLFKADQAVMHSDDFDHGTLRNGIDRIRSDDTSAFNGRGAGNSFDDEHPHWVSLLHYYHMTGDERIREAIADYGEWRRFRAGNPVHGARAGGALHHMRLWSRCLRDMALLWETFADPRDLADLRTMATALVSTVEHDGSRGRNMQRGYFYFGNPLDPKRRIHLFFLTEMNALAVHEAMRVLPAADPLREELRDYLSGLAWFTLQEAQVTASARGYPYGYFAAAANESGTRGDQTGTLLVHGYETSGDDEFLVCARRLAWRVAQDSHPLRASELATQVRIHRWLHRGATSALLVAPRVERHQDGSATLEWRSSPGARSVVVKYGGKRLVETLGFDPLRRTFAVDTATAMPFWAATNLCGEPTPAPAGTLQRWRTPVLPPGEWSFAVKLLGDGRLRGTGTPVAPSPADAQSGAGTAAPRHATPRRPSQRGEASRCRRNWRRRARTHLRLRALPRRRANRWVCRRAAAVGPGSAWRSPSPSL